eukprot:267140_1
MYLSPMKVKLRNIMKKMDLMEWERLRFHDFRKGFATMLQMVGVALSLISVVGRSKLQAAIYRHLLHRQEHLIPLANMYWCGKIINNNALDIDKAEFVLVKNFPKDIDKVVENIDKYLADSRSNFRLQPSIADCSIIVLVISCCMISIILWARFLRCDFVMLLACYKW